jgi:phage terminase large subunit GpA-like protein
MARCEVCGNDYYMSFEVVTAGSRHVFDSFECAIHKLAPICAHCGCKIVGHGIEAKDNIFCCASCSERSGQHGAVDNILTTQPTGSTPGEELVG